MNKLLADLNIMYVKLHNMHYNVVGLDFKPTHVMLEEEYDIIHQWIDEVAEAIKKGDGYPAGSLKEYLELTSIKEIKSQDINSKAVYANLIEDYTQLEKDIAIIKSEPLPTFLEDMLDAISDELATKLWFFKSAIK